MKSLLGAIRPTEYPPSGPRFQQVAEAADALGVGANTLYKELASGGFPALRVRTRLVVPTRAVTAVERAALAGRAVEARDWDGEWPRSRSRMLRLAQVARLLGVCDETLAVEIREGRWPAMQWRSMWLVSALALDEMERAALEGWTVVDPADWCGGDAATEPLMPVPAPVGGAA